MRGTCVEGRSAGTFSSLRCCVLFSYLTNALKKGKFAAVSPMQRWDVFPLDQKKTLRIDEDVSPKSQSSSSEMLHAVLTSKSENHFQFCCCPSQVKWCSLDTGELVPFLALHGKHLRGTKLLPMRTLYSTAEFNSSSSVHLDEFAALPGHTPNSGCYGTDVKHLSWHGNQDATEAPDDFGRLSLVGSLDRWGKAEEELPKTWRKDFQIQILEFAEIYWRQKDNVSKYFILGMYSSTIKMALKSTIIQLKPIMLLNNFQRSQKIVFS